MIATLFSILIAALVLFFTLATLTAPNWTLFAFAGFFFLFIYALTQMLSWAPLQKVQQNLTPRLLDIYQKDNRIRFAGAFLAVIALFSLYLAIDGGLPHVIGERTFTAIFFILIGISVDLIHYIFNRVTYYLNPFTVASEFTNHAINAAVKGNDVEVTNWVEAVAEVGINSAERGLPSLCNQAVTDLQLIMREYLGASKSFTHTVEKKAEGEKSDPVSFTLFFIFQRYEIILAKAIDAKLEPVVSTIISSLGKIILDSAKYDMSITTYPIHYLGTFALKAAQSGMDQIAGKALVTYVEVAKRILTDLDVTYLELQEPFYTMIGKMEELTKEIYRKNKDINFAILTAPFKQLKELFENEKMINHQDSRKIIIDINRVINEYEQLQVILRTIPPIQTEAPQ